MSSDMFETFFKVGRALGPAALAEDPGRAVVPVPLHGTRAPRLPLDAVHRVCKTHSSFTQN